MFRPEALLMEKEDNTDEYKVRVKSNRFIGNGYEVCLEQGESRWFSFNPSFMPEGEMPVFVKREAVLSFNN
jgi:hypothetical protein